MRNECSICNEKVDPHIHFVLTVYGSKYTICCDCVNGKGLIVLLEKISELEDRLDKVEKEIDDRFYKVY